TYSFGHNLANPEIRLTKSVYHSLGDFRDGVDGVGVQNGAYIYAVYSGSSDNGNRFGGVTVFKHGNSIADLSCKAGTIRSSLYAVSDLVRAGQLH
ncbi:MAG: hypothetical protein Q4D05_08855, partial [Acinetobacter sp.]|nr:hypothetical protein [Acinetobacter sp.]